MTDKPKLTKAAKAKKAPAKTRSKIQKPEIALAGEVEGSAADQAPAAKRVAPKAAAKPSTVKKAAKKADKKPAAKKPATKKAATPKPVAAEAETIAVIGAYFVAEPFAPGLSNMYPELAGHVAEFMTYDEAHEHAINYLIEHIERCEEQLWKLKSERPNRAPAVETENSDQAPGESPAMALD